MEAWSGGGDEGERERVTREGCVTWRQSERERSWEGLALHRRRV